MEEKKATYQRIVDYSANLMDKHFPKGECKERGEALVFNAELITYVMGELDRAREEWFTKEELEHIQFALGQEDSFDADTRLKEKVDKLIKLTTK